RHYQIKMAAASKVSGCQEIRPYRNLENLGIRKKRRRKLTPGDGQKRGVALGSKGVQIAAMEDYGPTNRRVVPDQQVGHPIFINVRRSRRQRLSITRRQGLNRARSA